MRLLVETLEHEVRKKGKRQVSKKKDVFQRTGDRLIGVRPPSMNEKTPSAVCPSSPTIWSPPGPSARTAGGRNKRHPLEPLRGWKALTGHAVSGEGRKARHQMSGLGPIGQWPPPRWVSCHKGQARAIRWSAGKICASGSGCDIDIGPAVWPLRQWARRILARRRVLSVGQAGF